MSAGVAVGSPNRQWSELESLIVVLPPTNESNSPDT